MPGCAEIEVRRQAGVVREALAEGDVLLAVGAELGDVAGTEAAHGFGGELKLGDRPEVERALRFIGDNLGRTLTVADVARAARLSEFHFNRVFHSIVGEPVGRFITRRRLEFAAFRLPYELHQSITVVALAWHVHEALAAAEECLTRAAQADPQMADVWALRGNTLIALERRDDALARLKRLFER